MTVLEAFEVRHHGEEEKRNRLIPILIRLSNRLIRLNKG